ncbi:hypothetical protein AB5I41_25195 [Sphingomonas sp. MMS24-JH45]
MDLISWKGAQRACRRRDRARDAGAGARGHDRRRDAHQREGVGIWAFDKLTGWILGHGVWSGRWEVTWEVQSPNFEPVNAEIGRLYRCLGSVAFEGSGTTADGHKIPYGFVGD